MLKISQGQIKENCDNINDNNNDYPNLSLKTKLLIKKKFSESDDDELNEILYSLDDFVDIANNFEDPDCSCRKELSFLLWRRSERKIIKDNYHFLSHENFIEKITQFFDEDYYYDIESEALQNVVSLFIELITPSYYEEDYLDDHVTKWTFGIHEIFSEYDSLPLYPEENKLIQERIENLYRHSSNIYERFISRFFFIFFIDESDKNTAISAKNELNESFLISKFLLFSWKFGGKNIRSLLKKLCYDDILLTDLLSVSIWRIITEYDVYNSKFVSKALWMIIYLFENLNENNPFQHFAYVTLVQLFINKDDMPLLDNLMEEEVDINFKTITEKIFYFSLKNLKNITINKELTSKFLRKINEREEVNNISLAIIKFFSLQLANMKKVYEYSPLKLVNKELLWILINSKSMNINLSKSVNQNIVYNVENSFLYNNLSNYQIYSTISFGQKPVLYNLEILLGTYYIEKDSITELTSYFLDEVKNIKLDTLKKDDKKKIIFNENKLKKASTTKSRRDNKKIFLSMKNNQENDNSTDSDSINNINDTLKQNILRHHRSSFVSEKSMKSIEEWRTNFFKLNELLIKYKRRNGFVKDNNNTNDVNRYNPLHRHIWNIYCINDIFFRIINKYFIFQNDEGASELYNIASSMNESSKKLNFSSIITQLCSNYMNMLIDVRNNNAYSNEYLYLMTIILSNIEKWLKTFYCKPTYWIKLLDDIIKVLLPFHLLESFNIPVESITLGLSNNEFQKSSNSNSDHSSNHKSSNSISIPSISNENNSNSNVNNIDSIPKSLPIIYENDNSNKLSSSSSSPTVLPPISLSTIANEIRSKNSEKKMKRENSFESSDTKSKPSSPSQASSFKSLSRSSSASSINFIDEASNLINNNKYPLKHERLDIKNEIKLFLLKSILKNIEETIRNCNFVPLNLNSISLPSIKNHKRSVSAIQKKNISINFPHIKVPLPPSIKKPKNQSIQKRRTIVASNKSSIKSSLEQVNKFENTENSDFNGSKNINKSDTINSDDTTDSEIYDDFDSHSSGSSSRNKESNNEDDDLNFQIKNSNIYEQETNYFIQFKLKDYIQLIKQYNEELNDIKVNCRNHLISSLQNLLEKHVAFLQYYYKKIVDNTNSEGSKSHYTRQRQHTAIESSLNTQSYPKIESLKKPVLLPKSLSYKSSLRDPLLIQNRYKLYSPSSSTKTPLHVNVTNIVLEPIKRNQTKIPSIKTEIKSNST